MTLCHLWQACPVPGLEDRLTPLERVRWSTYQLAQDRNRFATGAMMLRSALHALTGQSVPVERHCSVCGSDAHGRVFAPRPWHDELSLSLSHSASLVVVAAIRGRAVVGVDVELPRPRSERVAKVFMNGRELDSYRTHPDPDWALAATWVRKEAVLKAAGRGLAGDLRAFDVGDPERPALLSGWGAGPMSMSDLTLRDGYVGCVAITASGSVTVTDVSGPPASQQVRKYPERASPSRGSAPRRVAS